LNVLLDTNALLWSLLKPDRLSTLARRVIEEAETVHVSAASIYEIDFKREKLKAGGARREDSFLTRMPNNMARSLPALGFALLDISAEVASRAARLPLHHRDPWDRLIVAQAMILDAPLVSVDAALGAYEVDILW
jgi:PIN domain nuclease of toxin-antitoxin system